MIGDLIRLGTVTDAAHALGVDAARIWTLVADGELVADRPNEQTPWTIYARRQHTDLSDAPARELHEGS